MKHVLLFICLLTGINAFAQVYIDGIYYKYEYPSHYARVTSHPSGLPYYSGKVVIPESFTHNGRTYDVIAIDDFAFSRCTGLTAISIPNSVISICDYAFADCYSLTSVTIPNSETSMTRIGNNAFEGCSSLTSVIIPNSVTIIGDQAFSGCSGLTSITIGNSVTSIGSSAFGDCNGLASFTIPNSVTSISDGVFSGCSGLTSITIPNSVTSIGNNAFEGCSSLTSITIPNSVTSIGNNAFKSCSSLTSIIIPNSVTSIGGDAFSGCSGLTAVHITDLVAWCKISFSEYTSNPLCNAHHLYIDGQEIKNLVIPESVESIGNFAFGGCSGLISIKFPNNVTNIGSCVFQNCVGLNSVTFPNTVTSISSGTFYGCSGLTNVIIPEGVISIDSHFNGPSLWTSDYYGAFQECTSLTSIVIPNSMTKIEANVFKGCSSLKSVNIPNGMKYIGRSSFSGCNSLSSVIIGNSVTSIGESAFSDCSSLTSITIPNSVTSIDDDAFSGCTSLSSVTIGSSVTSIEKRAFSGCNLRNVLIKSITPPAFYYDDMPFTDQTLNHATLYVPTGCKDAYAYDKIWYKFINIKETAMTEEPLSEQQAYTLMDAGTFNYSVYDPVNDGVDTVSSDGIDQNNPNHSWQVMKANRKHYVYNIGAKKYLERNGDGFRLTNTPKSINVQSGDNGIVLGAKASQQWALVSNDRMSVVQAAIEEVKNAGNTVDIVTSNAGCSTFYDSYYAYTLPKGLSAQVVTGASNNRITYKAIADGANAGVVPKGTAVLLVSDDKSSGTFTLTATESNASYSGANLLHGSDETTVTTGSGYHYKLSYGQTGTQWDKVFGWYWGAKDGAPFQIEGNKAWLVVPSSAITRASGGYTVDGDATDITGIASEAEGDNVYYDMLGRRINTPASRGLYIKNGKKVVIK